MARFDDARVGDKVKAPTVFSGVGEIREFGDESESPFCIKVTDGIGLDHHFMLNGKNRLNSEAPALFYTNDAGDLLTERPKRKVKKEIACQAWKAGDGNWYIDTSGVTKQHDATLIVEVEELTVSTCIVNRNRPCRSGINATDGRDAG